MMRRMHVELLFPLDPAEVGIVGYRGPAFEEDIEVTLFAYEGATLVTLGGVWSGTLAALTAALRLALEVLGDLGSNTASAGLLQPIRTLVLDVCAQTRDLQNREAVPQ